MSRLKYIVLIMANVLGGLSSFYSLFLTERLNNYILPGNLICDVNKTVSCSTIYISEYSFVFNRPVSLFALLYFWFVLSVLIMNRNSEKHTQSFQMLSILNAAALFFCLYFLSILIFKLKSICISCLLIDAVVFLNFILLFDVFRETCSATKQSFKQLFQNNWVFHLSLLILFSTGLALYQINKMIINSRNKELAEMFFIQKQNRDIVCTNSIFFGNTNAIVKIRIFSDIYCGYCKIASEKYRQIFNNDTTVNIEFIYYPVNHKNPNIHVIPKINTFLYRVMITASRDKEFWNFHDLILKQAELPDSIEVFRIAEKSLAKYDEFRNNFLSNYNFSLEENILLAKEYKVPGTPTIFINGREFQQWTNLNLLRLIISAIKKI